MIAEIIGSVVLILLVLALTSIAIYYVIKWVL